MSRCTKYKDADVEYTVDVDCGVTTGWPKIICHYRIINKSH